MDKHFNSTEELIADEHFLAWYYRHDETRADQWTEWLRSNGQYQSMVDEAIAWMNEHELIEKEVPAIQVENAYQELNQTLDKARIVQMKPVRKRWWIPAAVAAVLIAIASVAFFNTQSSQEKLESEYGKIRQYQLPDGTEVVLNANSELTMDKKWEKNKSREVWLKGEAFFKVKKTPQKGKFIVHANSMDVVVTGTEFNVVSREEETSILLTEGSVNLETADGQVTSLVPGDFVKIQNKRPEKLSIDQEKVLSWKQAKLNFENTPMHEVARIITRHYGLKVRLSDSATGEEKISGIMPNDNLDVLIEALRTTGEFRISRTNEEIFISGE